MKISKKQKHGFTLMEILIVIGIFVIVSALSIPLYSNWQITAPIDIAVNELAGLCKLAQARSQAGLNNSAHGIYFLLSDEDKAVLYQGESYALRNQDFDYQTSFDSSLLLSTSWDGNEINFSLGLGMPSATGTIIISHSANNESGEVSINNLGIIQQ